MDVKGPNVSASAAGYLEEEEPEEESKIETFKFQEKEVRLDDDEQEEKAPVAFKKRKTNKGMRKKESE
jgi:hypothetical protein